MMLEGSGLTNWINVTGWTTMPLMHSHQGLMLCVQNCQHIWCCCTTDVHDSISAISYHTVHCTTLRSSRWMVILPIPMPMYNVCNNAHLHTNCNHCLRGRARKVPPLSIIIGQLELIGLPKYNSTHNIEKNGYCRGSIFGVGKTQKHFHQIFRIIVFPSCRLIPLLVSSPSPTLRILASFLWCIFVYVDREVSPLPLGPEL